MRKFKWTFFVLTLFVLSSCGSFQDFCCKRCNVQTSDSVWTKTDTVIIWDTIFKPYREVVFDTTFAFIPKDIVFHSEKKKSGLTSSIDIRQGKIKFKCAADSLMEINKHLLETINIFRQKVETKIEPCDKEHRTKLDYFCRWWSLISIILLVVSAIGYFWIRAAKD